VIIPSLIIFSSKFLRTKDRETSFLELKASFLKSKENTGNKNWNHVDRQLQQRPILKAPERLREMWEECLFYNNNNEE